MAACVLLALPLRAAAPSPRAPSPAPPLFVTGFGMQLHAAVTVGGRDRSRLERRCRYLLRPPFAQGAVQRTPDGQVRVHFQQAHARWSHLRPDDSGHLPRSPMRPGPARRPHRSILRCPRGAYCAPASFLGPTSPRDPSCSPCSFLTGLSSFPPSPPCSSLSCAPRHPIASRGCRSSLAYSASTSPSAPAVPDPCASPGPSPLPSKSPPSSMVLGRRRGPSLPDSSSCSRPAAEPCDQLHRALTPGALVSYVRGPASSSLLRANTRNLTSRPARGPARASPTPRPLSARPPPRPSRYPTLCLISHFISLIRTPR